jgi:hypothetical protein
MKIFRMIFFIAVTFLAGCDVFILHPPKKLSIGVVTARMNGQEWTKTYKNTYQVVRGDRKTIFPCIKSLLTVNFELYSANGFLRQQLYFAKIPEQTGKYVIVPDTRRNCNTRDSVYCDLFTSIDDGCVAGDAYVVLLNQDNYFQVDRYQKETGEISGKFQITLIRTNPFSVSNLPDTLRFTEGRFQTKIIVGRHIP